jgi:hypothetical protein
LPRLALSLCLLSNWEVIRATVVSAIVPGCASLFTDFIWALSLFPS